MDTASRFAQATSDIHQLQKLEYLKMVKKLLTTSTPDGLLNEAERSGCEKMRHLVSVLMDELIRSHEEICKENTVVTDLKNLNAVK